MEKFKYIKSNDGGYVAHSVTIPGAIVQAETLKELRVNAKEALRTLLEYMLDRLDEEDSIELALVDKEEFFKVYE